MLILTSPAKTLNEIPKLPASLVITEPRSLDLTAKINKELSKLSQKQIAKLMSINEKLASLNYQRFKDWHQDHTLQNSQPALYMYAGDIYRQLTVQSYTKGEVNYAQNSLRVISGFYGILRALDLMQPYRLEMKLKLPSGAKLTDYWRTECTKILIADCNQDPDKLVINLASKEYENAVDLKLLPAQVVNINFQEYRNGELKTVAINSKRARGMMIEYCIKNQIHNLDDLKKFNLGDYKFNSEEEGSLLFVKS